MTSLKKLYFLYKTKKSLVFLLSIHSLYDQAQIELKCILFPLIILEMFLQLRVVNLVDLTCFGKAHTCLYKVPQLTVVMDFMILFLDSVRVGQFTKKNRSESFVCLVVFPVADNDGMHGSQLSDLAPPSFSNVRANSHQSTHNITTKVLSAEECFMFGIRMLSPRPVPLHHKLKTVNSESARGSRVLKNER